MLLWRLEGNCETGDTQCINVKQVVVMESDCRLLSTDTIKDESLWEAESALAQLWEHEDRVVSKSFHKLCAINNVQYLGETYGHIFAAGSRREGRA